MVAPSYAAHGGRQKNQYTFVSGPSRNQSIYRNKTLGNQSKYSLFNSAPLNGTANSEKQHLFFFLRQKPKFLTKLLRISTILSSCVFHTEHDEGSLYYTNEHQLTHVYTVSYCDKQTVILCPIMIHKPLLQRCAC